MSSNASSTLSPSPAAVDDTVRGVTSGGSGTRRLAPTSSSSPANPLSSSHLGAGMNNAARARPRAVSDVSDMYGSSRDHWNNNMASSRSRGISMGAVEDDAAWAAGAVERMSMLMTVGRR